MYTKLTITKAPNDFLSNIVYSELVYEATALLNTMIAANKTDGIINYSQIQNDTTKIKCHRRWVNQEAADEWLSGIQTLSTKHSAYFEVVAIEDI